LPQLAQKLMSFHGITEHNITTSQFELNKYIHTYRSGVPYRRCDYVRCPRAPSTGSCRAFALCFLLKTRHAIGVQWNTCYLLILSCIIFGCSGQISINATSMKLKAFVQVNVLECGQAHMPFINTVTHSTIHGETRVANTTLPPDSKILIIDSLLSNRGVP